MNFGEICDLGKFINVDKELLDGIKKLNIEKVDNLNISFGTIGSADKFFSNPKEASFIRKEFGNCKCVEMEGAAIAQVCYLDKVPFIVIRGISVVANGNNKMDFHEYLKMASQKSANLLKCLIEHI